MRIYYDNANAYQFRLQQTISRLMIGTNMLARVYAHINKYIQASSSFARVCVNV